MLPPHDVSAPDLTLLVNAATRRALFYPDPDAVLNIESHYFNVRLFAESCKYDLDIGRDVWLNRSRWSRLTREYIPADGLARFLDQAVEIFTGSARDGATANMLFRDPDRYAKKHRWGGCLMGATFRGQAGKDPCLTFFSRTTYMGYMGLLDAAIAAVMANEIQARSCTSSEISFMWYISSMQLHCFKSLPFIYSSPKLMAKLEGFAGQQRKSPNTARAKMSPTWWNIAKWYNKVLEHYNEYGVDMLDYEKYGPFRRIKRRWLEYKGFLQKNLPPSLTVDQLDFSKCQ